jgi:hypothetical protein
MFNNMLVQTKKEKHTVVAPAWFWHKEKHTVVAPEGQNTRRHILKSPHVI